jgi:hypothetical protein
MTSRTETALLARGLDSVTARTVASAGYTLSKLQSSNANDLLNLGLTQSQITRIHDKSRPPIPPKTLYSILYKTAFTCCVCRHKDNPIIIHHIEEWHKTRSHEETNLVVLCLNCHSKAHSVSTISLNLNSQKLRAIKDEWEGVVRKRESDALFTKTSWMPLGGVWDYFNHNRITDVVGQLGLDLNQVKGFGSLSKQGVISDSGSYIWPSNIPLSDRANIRYIYDGSVPVFDRALRQFYAQTIKAILEQTQWLDISTIFKKSTAQLIAEYPIIAVTGAFRYKRVNGTDYGPGQNIVATRTAKGLRVEFSIDAWETTSQSAHSVNLSGLWRSTCILLVRNISISEKNANIQCTCLAIGTGFTEYVAPTPAIAFRDYDEE